MSSFHPAHGRVHTMENSRADAPDPVLIHLTGPVPDLDALYKDLCAETNRVAA